MGGFRGANLLVLFTVVRQNEIFQLHLHLDPLLISQSWPDVVWLSDGGFVRFQDHLRTVIVYMEGSQNQDQTGEGLQRNWSLFNTVDHGTAII